MDVDNTIALTQSHCFSDLFNTIDVGITILDRQHRVVKWNSFMQNHSGVDEASLLGENLFQHFAELPREWLEKRIDNVFKHHRARLSTTWQERPYIFKFSDQRYGKEVVDHMFQNMTLIPLAEENNEVKHVAILIYDVTDMATNSIELQSANSLLEQMSRKDALTQLYNRGFWEECISLEFERQRRHSDESCSVVIFDIDHFKDINDSYGHPAGDEVLRQVARVIQETVRKSDLAGRYGGEEFGIVLVGCSETAARFFTERLRKRIAALEVKYKGLIIRLTVSAGICELGSHIDSYKAWIENADQALYNSKKTGRNCTTLFSEYATG